MTPRQPKTQAVAAVAIWVISVFSTASLARPVEPYQLIRLLGEYQLAAIDGDKKKYNGQAKLLRQIGYSLKKVPAAHWLKQRNVDAAAVYLFSGGDPGVIWPILAAGHFSARNKRLIRGALAFSGQRPFAARRLLGRIDPARVRVELGGPLAFILGTLHMKSNFRRAEKFFDLARLISPGSIYEESALRRQILALGKRQFSPKDIYLARQYLWRFSRSPYAADFIEKFSQRAMVVSPNSSARAFSQIIQIIEILPKPMRLARYAALGKEAALLGKRDMVMRLAERVERLAPSNDNHQRRMQIYRSLVHLDYKKGISTRSANTNAVWRSRKTTSVSGVDPALDDTILTVLAKLVAIPSVGNRQKGPRSEPASPGLNHDPGIGVQIEKKAAATLRNIDQLLGLVR